MEHFEFKCPQCGKMVSVNDSLIGSVVACPHCEKGIVVPKMTKKPLLAPISHVETANRETDYAMRAIERRMGESISEQSVMENNEMDNTRQMSIADLLKLIGLIIVIGLIAFDVLSVRSQNKKLKKSMENQKAEMESNLKSAMAKGANYEQALRNAEQLKLEVMTKAKEKETELIGRIAKMEEEHRDELEKKRTETDILRMSFEDKMRGIKEDFNRQMEHMKAELRAVSESRALVQKEDSPKSLDERANGGDDAPQDQSQQSIAELRRRIKANQDEIKSLRISNPGYILVDYTKQARILETKFRPSGLGKYCAKDQITYVRSLFRCTACNWEGSELDGPCCDVSRKRSFNLWKKAVHDSRRTEQINARIDELLNENEILKKAMRR